MDRVLITSAQERFALAACRMLHESGYAVSAVADQTPAATHWSRCCSGRHVLPDAKADPQAFVNGLEAIVRREPHAVLLPGSDAALLAISERRAQLEQHVLLGIPDVAAVSTATDKIELTAAAAAAGLPVPETVVCETRDDGLRAARELGLPVVVKPRCTAHYDGRIYTQRSSAYVAEQGLLERLLGGFGSPYLVQRAQSGEVYSVVGVMTHDQMLGFGTARYLRTWPADGGNVAFAETVTPPPGMREKVTDLLARLGWVGIFELELIRASDGRFFAIDLNPRLYGSIALAWRAGAPLASIFCDWMLGRDPQPVVARAGVRYRWEDADLRYAVSHLKSGRYRDAAAALRPRRDVAHAHFRLNDPAPLLARALFLGTRSARRLRRPARDGGAG